MMATYKRDSFFEFFFCPLWALWFPKALGVLKNFAHYGAQ